MLATLPIGALLSGVFVWIDPGTSGLPWWSVSLLPVVALAGTAARPRPRHWRLGAWLVTTLVLGLGTADMVLRGEPYVAIFVGSAITLGGMVLRKRDTLALVGLALVSFLTSPWWA